MVASQSAGPIIAVLGGTGQQGGSVIAHLVKSVQPYQIRALTRDASKPKAKELEAQGVRLVEGNTDSSEDLDKAFQGADIVFAVTDFWSTMSYDKEVADGKRIVDAVKKANVGLFLWSGLELVREVTKGKITGVEHFDSKGLITRYARESGVNTFVVAPGCYMSNFVSPGSGLSPTKTDDGSLAISLPIKGSTVVSLVDISGDYGAYVREALESDAFKGKKDGEILAASIELTLDEIVSQFSEVTGFPTKYVQTDDKAYLAQFPEAFQGGARELLDMLHWFEDYGYYGGKDIQPSQQGLASPVSTWKSFVKRQDWSSLQ